MISFFKLILYIFKNCNKIKYKIRIGKDSSDRQRKKTELKDDIYNCTKHFYLTMMIINNYISYGAPPQIKYQLKQVNNLNYYNSFMNIIHFW